MNEFIKNKPNGATHYSNEDGEVVFFDGRGNYYDNDYDDWFEVYFDIPELKPL